MAQPTDTANGSGTSVQTVSAGEALPNQPTVTLNVSRERALTRCAIWTALAIVLWSATWSVYDDLVFPTPGQTNRLVDLSIAIVALPFPLLGLFAGVKALQWLLLFAWPGVTGINVSSYGIDLRLGPFGTKRYAACELTIAYPYELLDGDSDPGVEAHLPIEQQHESFLPRISHPSRGVPINQTILKFVSMNEAAIVAALFPRISAWREGQGATDEE